MTMATVEQTKMLLKYMKENSDLSRYKAQGPERRIQSKKLWLDLANQLNSLDGPVKTVAQWQKVWSDRKYLAKKAAAAAARRSTSDSVDDPLETSLTEEQKAIIGIIAGSGPMKTKFEINDESSSSIQENQPSRLKSEEDIQSCCDPLTPQGNKRRRTRWRPARPAPQNDFHSFLQESEAMNRAELAGIRHELGEMKDTLKDLVTELRHIRKKVYNV